MQDYTTVISNKNNSPSKVYSGSLKKETLGNGKLGKLEVTVIPIDSDPYTKIV